MSEPVLIWAPLLKNVPTNRVWSAVSLLPDNVVRKEAISTLRDSGGEPLAVCGLIGVKVDAFRNGSQLEID